MTGGGAHDYDLSVNKICAICVVNAIVAFCIHFDVNRFDIWCDTKSKSSWLEMLTLNSPHNIYPTMDERNFMRTIMLFIVCHSECLSHRIYIFPVPSRLAAFWFSASRILHFAQRFIIFNVWRMAHQTRCSMRMEVEIFSLHLIYFLYIALISH